MKSLIDIVNYRQSYLDLYNIVSLQYNWNGYGAPAGTAYPIYRAVPLLNLLKERRMSAPDIYATASRSVQFEWENGHDYLEFELLDDHVSVLRSTCEPDKETTYNDCNYSYKETDKMIEQIKRWNQGLPFLR